MALLTTTLAACRSATTLAPDGSDVLVAGAQVDATRFPNTKVRVITGAGHCAQQAFATNTNIVFDASSRDQNQVEISSTFQVDDSAIKTNAYWLAFAANLAYLDPGVIERELRQNWRASSFKFFEQKATEPLVDTQAFVAGFTHDPTLDIPARSLEVGIGRMIAEPPRQSVGDVAILSFRGTELMQLADIKTDMRTRATELFDAKGRSLGHTLQGYAEALDVVYPQIRDELRRLGKPVFVTGHSLGAGLATLATARLMAEDDPRLRVAALYTFGSSRTGLADFRDAFNAAARAKGVKLRRYVNRNDMIPVIPETISGLLGGSIDHVLAGGWQHIGNADGVDDKLVWFANNRTPYSNAAALKRMADSIWVLPLGTSWVSDHLMAGYVLKLETDAFGVRSRCPGDVAPEELP
jgi:hypothetical protein